MRRKIFCAKNFLNENEESYCKNRFEGLSETEDMILRGCFEELENNKFIKVLWGDNIPIHIQILKAGYSYETKKNKIEIIRLENFTVFENFKLELSRGINIFVGENVTGKTHLLKILYAVCLVSSNPRLGGEVLRKCFNEETTTNNLLRDKKCPNLFISVLPENIESKKTFEIQTKVNVTVEAEGLKKIGLLWQRLMIESITENSILLWDEPEANLNPRFLPKLVGCLLELSRRNVQIFISTHNYIFAKYFII